MDGLPLRELAQDESVINALGGSEALAKLPRELPKQLLLLAGIRSGKSLLAAAIVVQRALSCDVSKLGPGEVPRAAIVSLTKDTAQPALDHIIGRVTASPKLSQLVIGKPKAESIMLRHPSGRAVEITVSAGARAAGTLVARWLASVVFDESPRMASAEDAVINLEDQLVSIAGRLLPGAQVIMSGSPWAAYGYCFQLWDEHWGKPDRNIVVVRAQGPQLNPNWWTPERTAELKARDPDAFRVDIMCEWLDPESGLLALSDLENCRRRDDLILPPKEGHYYSAAIDPATRGNAWTLVVIERRRDQSLAVVLHQQWVGSQTEPLSPSNVLGEIASLLRPYRLTSAFTDQWAADSLIEIAGTCNLWLTSEVITDRNKLEMFSHLRALVHDKKLELPPDLTLLRDLASVKKKVTATGVTIHLPQQGNGRHCDYAPALALVLQHEPREPDTEPALTEKTALTVEQKQKLEADALAAIKEDARRQIELNNKKKSKDFFRRY